MDKKLSEQLVRAIRRDILEGAYAVREFISEAQMAEKYGVSKAPVKEAMHTLAEQGFLTAYPRKGYMVNAYSVDEITASQAIRRCLESRCVREAIRNASDEQVLALRDTLAGDEDNMDPGKTVNARFHLGLAELSGNPFMRETLQTLVNKATMGNLKGKPDIENFNHILEAILARDEEEAQTWLLRDIRYL